MCIVYIYIYVYIYICMYRHRCACTIAICFLLYVFVPLQPWVQVHHDPPAPCQAQQKRALPSLACNAPNSGLSQTLTNGKFIRNMAIKLYERLVISILRQMLGRLFQGNCLVNSTNGTAIITVPQIPTVLALWESRWQTIQEHVLQMEGYPLSA